MERIDKMKYIKFIFRYFFENFYFFLKSKSLYKYTNSNILYIYAEHFLLFLFKKDNSFGFLDKIVR
jgi:hypothetical protein